MALTLRNARAGDVPVLVDFNIQLAWETEHKRLDPTTLTSGILALFKDPSKGFYIVAEEEGAIIGQTMITYEWSDWRNGMFWWIQSAYVRPEKRGAGVFSALYCHVEQLATEKGGVCGLRLYVEEDNARAQEAYRKLGMTRTGYRLFEVELR